MVTRYDILVSGGRRRVIYDVINLGRTVGENRTTQVTDKRVTYNLLAWNVCGEGTPQTGR